MYCFNCGGENKSTAFMCEHCEAEVLSKKDYYAQMEKHMAISGEKQSAMIIRSVIMGIILFFGVIYSGSGGSITDYLLEYMDWEQLEPILGVAVVLLPIWVVLHISSRSKHINKKVKTELKKITYLSDVPVVGERDTLFEKELGTEREAEEDVEEKPDTKIKSSMPATAKKEDTPQKEKVGKNIYLYSGKRMGTYWRCGCCDVENTTAKATCIVCGTAR